MQLYQGLPKITNKIPVQEQGGIPHHLLGQIGPQEESWIVSKFVRSACSVINDIRSRNHLPILVGGTHYYTQSLLFEDSTVDSKQEISVNHDSRPDIRQTHPILNAETTTILEKLRQVDPIMANRWHPNDRRKIQRSLEIWYQTGKPASEIYQEQVRCRTYPANDKFPDGDDISRNSRLRFPTLLLWVHAEKDVLRDRLDRRVEKMVQDGLLDEVDSLESYRRAEEAAGKTIDLTRGIWQCIGYKQFQKYLEARGLEKSPKEIDKLKDEAIEQTQAATRQYSKRQIRWIRIKLLHALKSAGAGEQLYLLDSTNLDAWHAAVHDPSISLVQQFLEGSSNMPPPAEVSAVAQEMLRPQRDYDLSDRPDLWQRRTCEICNTFSVTESEWHQHIKSKGHRSAMKNSKLQSKAG